MPEDLEATESSTPFQSPDSAKLTDELEQMYREPAVTPEADKQAEVPEFTDDMQVSVLRGDGALDNNWTVYSTSPDGVVKVITDDPKKGPVYKDMSPQQLAEMQHKFVVGQPVRVESSHGEDGWNVSRQLPNGEVVVIKPTIPGDVQSPHFIKRVPAAKLWESEYGPRPEQKKAEKRGIGGLFKGRNK